MSTFRYRSIGPSVADLQRYVDAGITTIRRVRRQIDSEVDLADDDELGSLDAYMSTEFGYERVTGAGAQQNLSSDQMSFGALAIAIAGTEFLSPFGVIASALSAEIQATVIGVRRYRRIGVRATAAGTGTGTLDFTVRRGAADTLLTINVANSAPNNTVSIATDEEFVDGDLISLSVRKNGTIITTPVNIIVSIG